MSRLAKSVIANHRHDLAADAELAKRGVFTIYGCCVERAAPRKRCAECSDFAVTTCAFALGDRKTGTSCGRHVCAKHAVKQRSGATYCRAHNDFEDRKAAQGHR